MGAAIASCMSYVSDCVFTIGEDGAGGIQVLAVGAKVVVMTRSELQLFSLRHLAKVTEALFLV